MLSNITLLDAESHEEQDVIEKDRVMKGYEVMGDFVPKCSQNHGKG